MGARGNCGVCKAWGGVRHIPWRRPHAVLRSPDHHLTEWLVLPRRSTVDGRIRYATKQIGVSNLVILTAFVSHGLGMKFSPLGFFTCEQPLVVCLTILLVSKC